MLRASLPSPKSGATSPKGAGPSRSTNLAAPLAEVRGYIDQLRQFDITGKQAPVAEQDARWQRSMVDVQNTLEPGLKLKVFDLSDTESSSFKEAVSHTRQGEKWRALLNIDRGFGAGIPKHVVAVEVSGKKGAPSVVAIDSLWACAETSRILPKALEGTHASLELINTGMQKGPVGCAVFALEVAKEMLHSGKAMEKMHSKNGKGEDLNDQGIRFAVKNGKQSLPPAFFKHTTSKNVLDDLPQETRRHVEQHFTEHLKERQDARGKTIAYSNSIEMARIRMMEQVLEAAGSRASE
ncbi:YopJ family acetyltransferase [Paracidovorax konjaci]|uniref:YopJ Serine/Threonine acetyltransferase n=1 Tax=Paracidovorax konjaci TaxID=32040 RepID=A0A1I1T9N1_9BURK|nr:YopJ family acetyltransferase [Paracidovorax konjaci]SFD55331.1 YopJ Serine/Threonine acetyltransferase [Paracidovorax konjaci]